MSRIWFLISRICDGLVSSSDPVVKRNPSTVMLLAPENVIPGIAIDPSAGTATTRVIAACLTVHRNDDPEPPPVTQIVLPSLAALATAELSADKPLTDTSHDGGVPGTGEGLGDGDGP